MSFARFMDVWAIAAAVSLLFWAITGLGWWAPTNVEFFSEYMRAILLTALHIIPLARVTYRVLNS